MKNPILINFIFVGSFWMKGTLSYMIISILPNSHFGKRLVAGDMIRFGSDVGTQILFFCFFSFGCLQALGGVPSNFAQKFHVKRIQNHLWRPLVAEI